MNEIRSSRDRMLEKGGGGEIECYPTTNSTSFRGRDSKNRPSSIPALINEFFGAKFHFLGLACAGRIVRCEVKGVYTSICPFVCLSACLSEWSSIEPEEFGSDRKGS